MAVERLNQDVVRVPDVEHQPLAKARLIIENAGLRVDEVLFRESYEEENTVLEQKPRRGQMIYEKSPVTLFVARRSYMELLPAIYRRSDAIGRNVVRDICFLFEHMFSSVENILDMGEAFYDPHECPEDFLHWLASWTAMVLAFDWPVEKKRAVLKRGVDLYRLRGTRRGLTLFLTLFTGHEPTVVENKWPFKGFRVHTDAAIGIDSVILPPVDLAHCLTVTMPIKFTDVTPEMVIRIHEIIQREKPAHTHYYLEFSEDKGDDQLREFFAIGVRSGVGIGQEIVAETIEDTTTAEAPSTETKPKRKRTRKRKSKDSGDGDEK